MNLKNSCWDKHALLEGVFSFIDQAVEELCVAELGIVDCSDILAKTSWIPEGIQKLRYQELG
jgi:hypothetical protein